MVWNFVNRKRDSEKKPHIGNMMIAPYTRIIPMHLTIVFGGLFFFSQFGLAIFLVLKTIADLAMHAAQHED